MISLSIAASGIACAAARRRLGRGTDDPAAERGKVALLGVETAIEQVPAHALRHAELERRDQPSGGEVVVDIGPDAHRDAEAVDRGLQRVAVELELGPRAVTRGMPAAFSQSGQSSRRMRHPQQRRSLQIARRASARWRVAVRRPATGRPRTGLGDKARPLAVAELDAAAPVLAERRRGAAGGDADVDVGLLLAEIRQSRDQPFHRKGRPDADGQHAHAGGRGDLRGQARQRIEDRRQPALIGAAGGGQRPAGWPCARTARTPSRSSSRCTIRLIAAAETLSSAPAAAKLPLRAAASNALMPLRKSSRRKSFTLRKTDARAR